jgi:hypothetical protein
VKLAQWTTIRNSWLKIKRCVEMKKPSLLKDKKKIKLEGQVSYSDKTEGSSEHSPPAKKYCSRSGS